MRIRLRKKNTRRTFCKTRSLFCDDNISLKLKHQPLKYYIWSILICGAESGTLKAPATNRQTCGGFQNRGCGC